MKTFITVLICCALALVTGIQSVQAQTRGPGQPPLLGADLGFDEWPHPLVQGWQDKDKGDEMAAAFKNAGIRSFRFTFRGIYSPLGPEASARVKAENKAPNEYPWFPFSDYADYIARHDFTTVVGVNVEEGPKVAAGVVEEFVKRGALSKLVAIELSNEPHLNHRPWLPEDYARHAADVIRALTPYGVRFALPLTVGKEKNTPTKLSDSEWNRRMLEALSSHIELKSRSDIYGVLHLYSRGVRGSAIEAFNREVKPFAPNMRYLVTEFNIKLFLDGNPHLTTEYAREFALRLAEVMAQPDVEAMYVHAVPYHSILYWSNGRQVATVIGHKDSKLKREDLTRGWHLTPAGKVYDLYSRLAWNGEIVTYVKGSKQSYWAVKSNDGRTIITLLNIGNGSVKKDLKIGGQKLRVTAPGRSIVVVEENGQMIEQLLLR
jgi:hypothetical protein